MNFQLCQYFILNEHLFYNSPRVKQMSFTIFESIQSISGSGSALSA